MKLRTSVTISTYELEALLMYYVRGDVSLRASYDRFKWIPVGPMNGITDADPNDVSAQLRFDDDVEGAIVDIYTADPVTDHDDREGMG